MIPLLASLAPYRLIIGIGLLATLAGGAWYSGYSYANKRATARDNERSALAFKEYIKTERENLNLAEQVKVQNEQIKTDSRTRIANDADGLRNLIRSSAASAVQSCASASANSGSSGSGNLGSGTTAANKVREVAEAYADAIKEIKDTGVSCGLQVRNVAKTLAEIEAKQ